MDDYFSRAIFFPFLFDRATNVERNERTFFFFFCCYGGCLFVYTVVAEKYRDERTSSVTAIETSLHREERFFSMYLVRSRVMFGSFFVLRRKVVKLFLSSLFKSNIYIYIYIHALT